MPPHATDRFAARVLSLVLALFLAGTIFVYPTGFTWMNHGLLVLVMWGISAAFVHGVGFTPRSPLWRVLLGPWTAWALTGFALASAVVSTLL